MSRSSDQDVTHPQGPPLFTKNKPRSITKFGDEPRSASRSNRLWWAKGDLNPHVPKDTGT